MQPLAIPLDPRDWFDSLNPFVSFRNYMQDLYLKTTDIVEKLVISPGRISDNVAVIALYTQSLNLAAYLAYMALVLSIVVAAFLRHKIGSALNALLVFIVIGAALPVWLTISDQMVDLGTTMARAAQFYDPGEGHRAADMPGIENPVGGIFAYLLLTGSGITLAGFLAMFDFGVLLFKFWFPIAYSISSFGERSKKVTNIVLSIGLVSTLFGRAVAVFCIEVGQVAVYETTFGTQTFLMYLYTVLAYGCAALLQFVLLYVCYKGIAKIEGKVSALTRGTVNSDVRGKVQADINTLGDNRNKALKPIPVVVKHEQPTVKQTVKKELRNHVVSKATTAAAAAATAAGVPAPVAMAVAGVAQRHYTKPGAGGTTGQPSPKVTRPIPAPPPTQP